MRARTEGSWATRRSVLVAAGSAILVRTAHADPLPDGRFRDEVTAILRTIRPDSEIIPDDDLGQVKVGRFTIALTNLYPRVASLTGDTRRRAIERYLSAALKDADSAPSSAVPSLASVQSRLRVQLLPRSVLGQVPDLASRSFSETLVVAYVVDEADRMLYVTRRMLEQWGVDESSMQASVEGPALANLAAASKDATFGLALADGVPVLAMAQTGDNYDAARLMLPRYLDEIRTALKVESITVAVPNRDLLMAWPSEGTARAGMAAEVRAQLRTKPYGRSDELFHFDQAGLRPLTAAERAAHGR